MMRLSTFLMMAAIAVSLGRVHSQTTEPGYVTSWNQNNACTPILNTPSLECYAADGATPAVGCRRFNASCSNNQSTAMIAADIYDPYGCHVTIWLWVCAYHYTTCYENGTTCAVSFPGSGPIQDAICHNRTTDHRCMVFDSTDFPTAAPTKTPSFAPTFMPSFAPSFAPSLAPSFVPSFVPTAAPTTAPTTAPSMAPTTTPTAAPTKAPATAPTTAPTAAQEAQIFADNNNCPHDHDKNDFHWYMLAICFVVGITLGMIAGLYVARRLTAARKNNRSDDPRPAATAFENPLYSTSSHVSALYTEAPVTPPTQSYRHIVDSDDE